MQAATPMYGTEAPSYTGYAAPAGQMMMRKKRAPSLKLFTVFSCLIIPWIMFVALFSLSVSYVRYKHPHAPLAVSIPCFLVVLGMMIRTFKMYRLTGKTGQLPLVQGQVNKSSFKLHAVATVMMLLTLFIGGVMGDQVYATCFKPYYDVRTLQVYPDVDPAQMRGNQLMDAGRVTFTEGSALDRSKSMGFRNGDWYCVAPITRGGNGTNLQYDFDFWAVGLNCCKGASKDFQCGEFSNPAARSGLRLLREDERSFFRLAVQQAEATYSIRSLHPVFFYWMEDPREELMAYREDGFRFFFEGVLGHFAFSALVTMGALAKFAMDK